MQQPQNNHPVLPNAGPQPQQSQPYPAQERQPYPAQPPCHGAQPRPRRGRFRRFVRGYLMLVGALTTLYVLVMLLVSLFVEVGKWSPTIPIV